MQRTRSSPSALRSPLTRRPLGGTKSLLGYMAVFLGVAAFAACSRKPSQIAVVPAPAAASPVAEATLDYSLCDQIEKGQPIPTVPRDSVAPPVPLYRKELVVPEGLKGAARGEIVLEATITCRGEVRDIKVIHSLDRSVDQAFAEAFRKWRFRPAVIEKRFAVPAIYTLRAKVG